MSYELEFHEDALKEWKKLDPSIKEQFKKQLVKRLENPHVPSAQLRGKDMQNTYKIKLRDVGYRLVYEVNDHTITVLVLAVAKRDKNRAYDLAERRKAEQAESQAAVPDHLRVVK
ncbi:type II toxin-antitoxin system RelE family toxin [Noviherbaspirillum saxi]|uniref:Type II toxin-antitoxin system RelE/ParE family toxin n=1 Tax=Noviherbaspirillum saxi TaxID=2320863 RepID=A0A3A3FV52_9BURK|nr:type II toxin-antitoxin system RelE/ParE family toxin [Noviherbaspirillum saxi]RJF99480.1 type II toxin-antitoxin system RelE/ParE family toxin [Noviherbaspirillum saxi]